MLLQRVLTALVLLPLAVAAIWFLPTTGLALLFTALALVAAHEWAALSGLSAAPAKFGYVALGALLILLAVFALPAFGHLLLWGCAALWWLIALVWIVRYPAGFSPSRPSPALRAGIGLLIFASTISGLAALHAHASNGPLFVLATFVIVWAADIGAYFAGRGFGRHKLAPRVSPGKTWEGFVGGFVAAVAASAGMAVLLFAPEQRPWLLWLLLCAALSVVSVIGDLSESLLKRHAGVKDSGGLLPGHGGVLDRVDSLLAVAPLMALGVYGLSL